MIIAIISAIVGPVVGKYLLKEKPVNIPDETAAQ